MKLILHRKRAYLLMILSVIVLQACEREEEGFDATARGYYTTEDGWVIEVGNIGSGKTWYADLESFGKARTADPNTSSTAKSPSLGGFFFHGALEDENTIRCEGNIGINFMLRSDFRGRTEGVITRKGNTLTFLPEDGEAYTFTMTEEPVGGGAAVCGDEYVSVSTDVQLDSFCGLAYAYRCLDGKELTSEEVQAACKTYNDIKEPNAPKCPYCE